ncbi:hypothetical protein BaRGS_00036199, partial [Batillaria attramentaria]
MFGQAADGRTEMALTEPAFLAGSVADSVLFSIRIDKYLTEIFQDHSSSGFSVPHLAMETDCAPICRDGDEHCTDILIVEAFYCGSHKQLMDCLMRDPAIGCRADLVTMSGKKWHWRARTSALHLSGMIRTDHKYRVVFASSVLNLAELVALRPDLAALHKVLYFHENQLQYPVRKQQGRDFQYGYNQILSCLVADVVAFNSKYNMESFLSSINGFLKLMPDYRPKGLSDRIRPKCRVLYFPMLYGDISQCLHNADVCSSAARSDTQKADCADDPALKRCRREREPGQCEHSADDHSSQKASQVCGGHDSDADVQFERKEFCNSSSVEVSSRCSMSDDASTVERQAAAAVDVQGGQISRCAVGNPDDQVTAAGDRVKPLHIVWPHRWEHDKDPHTFFDTLFRLKTEGLPFSVSVLGETFTDVPEIFGEAKEAVKDHIHSWGFQAEKSNYYRVLQEADIVVSTSKHEFFGVAMLEAVYLGCYPLCPRSLVYPEIYPDECLYSTPAQLYKRLRYFCRRPRAARTSRTK